VLGEHARPQSTRTGGKRPELDDRLGALINAIFQTVPEEKKRLEKVNPFRPDKETVYVDLVPSELAARDGDGTDTAHAEATATSAPVS